MNRLTNHVAAPEGLIARGLNTDGSLKKGYSMFYRRALPEGWYVRRNPRMDYLNVRALNRAGRRIRGAAKAIRQVPILNAMLRGSSRRSAPSSSKKVCFTRR